MSIEIKIGKLLEEFFGFGGSNYHPEHQQISPEKLMVRHDNVGKIYNDIQKSSKNLESIYDKLEQTAYSKNGLDLKILPKYLDATIAKNQSNLNLGQHLIQQSGEGYDQSTIDALNNHEAFKYHVNTIKNNHSLDTKHYNNEYLNMINKIEQHKEDNMDSDMLVETPDWTSHKIKKH